MANKCGECLLYQGPKEKCPAGYQSPATSSAPSSCFKGPASLFSGKKCGGCRLYKGPKEKCTAGYQSPSISSAPSGCYSPSPG